MLPWDTAPRCINLGENARRSILCTFTLRECTSALRWWEFRVHTCDTTDRADAHTLKNMQKVVGLAAGLAFCGSAAGTSFCDAPGWNQVWRDDFNGTAVDQSAWNIVESQDNSIVRDSCGLAKNVEVKDGNLVLTSRREQVSGCKYDYTTGAIQSQNKKYWQGNTRACVRAILPGVEGHSKGVWPAHWMMPNTKACWPTNGEIDIMEMINGDGWAHATYHWNKQCSKDSSHSGQVRPANSLTDFHEYAVEYNATHISFYVDSQFVDGVTKNTASVYDVPYYMILQTALGGPWPGPVSPNTVFPIEHKVDYVSISQKKQ